MPRCKGSPWRTPSDTTFVKAYRPALGEDTAKQAYTASINSGGRNEHALMTIREPRLKALI